MPIVLMICFARSGGTLLNRCLGSLPNVVIMSEVNPLGGGGSKTPNSPRTVREQARHWYGIDVSSEDFTDSIVELSGICESSGKRLVVRDWTFVNFVPTSQNEYTPANRLLSLESLEKRCKVIPFAFVRDTIDVWISRGTPPLGQFCSEYSRYIDAIVKRGIPIFKYEDFCHNPDRVMQNICNYCNLQYNHSYRNYFSFDTVSGDVQSNRPSRGAIKSSILPLRRKLISRSLIAKIEGCHELRGVNELLGYPTSYYSVPRESYLDYTVERLQRLAKSFSKSSIISSQKGR